MVDGAVEREFHRRRSDAHCPRAHRRRGIRRLESPVLDLVFVAAIVAAFVLVGLIAKGVEKL
jgi:hypothetical protein